MHPHHANHESLGAKDKIGERFDRAIYDKYRTRYIAYALRNKNKSTYYKEIIDSFAEHNIAIPFAARICLIPCKFEINRLKSRFAATGIGKKIYKRLN